MSTAKSEHDSNKEMKEEACFEAAYQASLKHDGKVKEIMEYLHGIPYRDRSHNDSPDLVYICKRGKRYPKETIVGIEHFRVSQCSKKKNGSIQAIDLRNKAELKKTYEIGHAQIEANGTISEEIGCKILDQCSEFSYETLRSGYSSLISSLQDAISRHLSHTQQYRKHLEQIANGRPIELAFLIEVQTYGGELFLNNNGNIERIKGHIMPMYKGLVSELEKIDKKLVNYIVICNSIFNPVLDNQISTVTAIRSGNIKKHLTNQHITIYDYVGEDRFETSPMKFQSEKAIGPTLSGNDTYYLPEPLVISPESELQDEMLKALRAAYIAKKCGIPFVATRPVQCVLFAFESEIIDFSGSNGNVMPILKNKISQAEIQARYEAFDRKYPRLKENGEQNEPIR